MIAPGLTDRRRVVITGMGVISPVGNDLETAWGNLLAGRSGLGEITRFDIGRYEHKAGGEIKDALKAVTRKDVQVDVKVDPTIIGGLIVKLGSRMVDSSLRTKLNSIKHAMKEVS